MHAADTAPALLAVADRNGQPESGHFGSIAVVDGNGRSIARLGAVDVPVFSRSTCKPLQALPLAAHPEFPRLQWSSAELALACASHSGQPVHTLRVARMLASIGCSVTDLACGVHPPYWIDALGAEPQPLRNFNALHNNCSGKHAGMLACCQLLGSSSADYLDLQHPLQQAILEAVGHWSAVPIAELGLGVDGCSAPTFAMPLRSMALAYARLVASGPDPRYGMAGQQIARAMRQHPLLVSGSKRLDARLMRVGRGRWLSKIGAEGVWCFASADCGWGIAVKISDGAERAARVVAVETLRQLQLLDPEASAALADIASGSLRNCNGSVVGTVRPVFRLN